MNRIVPTVLVACATFFLCVSAYGQEAAPLRLALARLTQDHVAWVFSRPDKTDIEIVGVYEPNKALRERFIERYGLPPDLFYTDLEDMLDEARPEAVAAFGSIAEHVGVVEAAALRGVHVMMEKPLAFTTEDALRMRALAEQYAIHVLTNYETTWYPSMYAAQEAIADSALGPIRKMVIRDGHEGPAEIGVSAEFLEWLTDPAYNGGGAIVDFGCYGANLATWLMGGEPPRTVTAVTQQIKPDVYPQVDDEATILLTWPHAQAIIQASWNWPFNRKDMHVYGRTGYLFAPHGTELRIRQEDDAEERVQRLAPRPAPFDDPFSYLAAVVRGDVQIADTDLSSLRNNVIVARILDAARESARTGRTVVLE